jgi:hypothetical protein
MPNGLPPRGFGDLMGIIGLPRHSTSHDAPERSRTLNQRMPFTFKKEQEIQKLVVETCPSIFSTYPANFPLMTC